MQPGTPFSRDHLIGIIDGAIDRSEAELAMQHARNLDAPSDLDRALRLTIALGIAEAPTFQPAARRFVARFCTEQRPSMEQVRKVADALDQLTRFTLRSQAREALLDLARQLRQLEN